jgi:hypothetical protein
MIVVGVALGVACGRGPFDADGLPPAWCSATPPGAGVPFADVPPNGGGCAALGNVRLTFGCSEPGDCGPLVLCNPRQQDGGDGPFTCCSDDPATGRDATGVLPYFSQGNNDLGTKGVCVRTDRIDDGLHEPEAKGCPVPCNPTWPASDIQNACGRGRVCCQTRAVETADCVRDPQTGLFRPVTGEDIGVRRDDDKIVTDWNQAAHATHQDPAGVGCLGFALGDVGSEVFEDCIRQLSVADQRGFCTDADDCCVDRDHETACDRLN